MLPETWLALSRRAPCLLSLCPFPLCTCVAAKVLAQNERNSSEALHWPSACTVPSSLLLVQLANCSNPCRTPPRAHVSVLLAVPALPFFHLTWACEVSPYTTELFPTSHSMSGAGSSKEARMSSFFPKQLSEEGHEYFALEGI